MWSVTWVSESKHFCRMVFSEELDAKGFCEHLNSRGLRASFFMDFKTKKGGDTFVS